MSLPSFAFFRRVLLCATLVAPASCGRGNDGEARDTAHLPRSTRGEDLTGAGATFPYPLYARWFGEWARSTGVRINYQSIGSGGGIRQLTAGTVDFGATDVPMTAAEIAAIAPRTVLHVPTAVGAVAITYNLPGLTQPLRLSGEALAGLLDGQITKWNDARLLALNPGVALPARDVLVVYRSDGGGSTYLLTSFLARASARWAAIGPAKDVRWPVGLGGRGNEGVAAQVKAMPGAIGYVEVIYARQNRLPVAALRNRSGAFTTPDSGRVQQAAASALLADSSRDLRLNVIDAPGADSYPLASLTWMLLPLDKAHAQGTRELARFLKWALTDGSAITSDLGYAPLPPALRELALRPLDSLATARPRAP
jgi:phosphate transport system substrate-binding protein